MRAPLRSLSLHTIWCTLPLLSQVLEILYGEPPPPSVQFLCILCGAPPPLGQFFAHYMVHPPPPPLRSVSLHPIWCTPPSGQSFFNTIWCTLIPSCHFFGILYGAPPSPQVSFFHTISCTPRPLRSISSFAI